MNEKKITIAGKEAKLLYCFQTEIAYHDITGEELNTFINSTIKDAKDNKTPDGKKVACAIVAANIASSEYEGIEQTLTIKDILHKANAAEILQAFAAILELFIKFYQTPVEEANKDDKKGGSKKPKKS